MTAFHWSGKVEPSSPNMADSAVVVTFRKFVGIVVLPYLACNVVTYDRSIELVTRAALVID